MQTLCVREMPHLHAYKKTAVDKNVLMCLVEPCADPTPLKIGNYGLPGYPTYATGIVDTFFDNAAGIVALSFSDCSMDIPSFRAFHDY